MTKRKKSIKEEPKKFKVTEIDPKSPKAIEWEGETVTAESTTKLQDDKGQGQPLIIRFFDFGANVETFKQHKPTAQELFNNHWKGIHALLWSDGLEPYELVEPRLVFSKDRKHYGFFITCKPTGTLLEKPQTLGEIISETERNTN